MPRNSKDGSLNRYKKMVDTCERYHIYITYHHPRLTMRSETKAKAKSAIHYVRCFKEALSRLDTDLNEMIRNEFLNGDHTFWWRKKYSRSTFYRYRDKAIIRFFEEFNL